MAEIILPTKATQDSIKQDTANILSQFPINGGTNFEDYIFSTGEEVSQHEKTEALNISGSGILHSLYVYFSSNANSFTIQFDDGLIYRINHTSFNTHLVFNVAFKSSVKIANNWANTLPVEPKLIMYSLK